MELLAEGFALRRAARAEASRAERLGWSSLLLRWCAARLSAANARSAEIQSRLQAGEEHGSRALWDQVHGPRPPLHGLELRDLCVGAWVECSVSMAALCRARGIAYVHVLQPTLWDQGSKPLAPAEVQLDAPFHVWKQATRLGYPQLRARADELARRGVELVDASRAVADVREPLYFDHGHVVKRGTEILWERIAPAVLDALAGAIEREEKAR
jgi:hypothetical protein